MLRVVLMLTGVFMGCETQRIEHHKRPAWHYSLAEGTLKNEVVREDGTIVKYSLTGGSTTPEVLQYFDSLELESKDEETGKVTLLAVIPEQLFTQTLICLRDRRWDILYDQLLSENAKAYFDSRQDDLQSLRTFFETNRRELAKSLQKMVQGKQFGDILIKDTGQLMYLTFAPQFSGTFKFKLFVLKREGQFLKLHSIE